MAGLATHIDPDELVKKLHDHPVHSHHAPRRSHINQVTPYSSRYAAKTELPKFKIPQASAPADAVHQLIKDELDLDGRPNLNLASFVGTYMEPQAEQLMIENLSKNMSDADEYPAMMDMHARCISMLAHMWHVQPGETAIGTATTGSSEAIHLAGLAMKRRWHEARTRAGKDTLKPNILMGANAQVALEKFARYFDVEPRILPVSRASRYRLDPALVQANIDENTIGIFVILGSTYTGHYEPVAEIAALLDAHEQETGQSIDIHVDAASGGFIAPFTHAGAGPDTPWDFALPRVKSINVSGHKFGLVYAGVGWIVWRDEHLLPRHLVFELHYLGGTEQSYTLNFSRPGAQVIAQYFNLVHLGVEGYRNVMENALANARLLSRALEATGWYECVSDVHRRVGSFHLSPSPSSPDPESDSPSDSSDSSDSSAAYNPGLPVVAFTLSRALKASHPHMTQDSISTLLRAKQYIIPNYALPPHEDGTEILRVVVRESMSLDLLHRLIADICEVTDRVMRMAPGDLAVFDKVGGGSGGGGGGRGPSVEKRFGNAGLGHEERDKARRPMGEGVHRSVC
ncbi:glutamate decarboxylase [Pseudovirgaria hyperparasitica]|uniref:Glutamate decarboxylase n=1 Tax=Pseudovirgaria hyperparasitica TaxID=470096 RepID=A0A6A6WI72_9PEZI|nr:glutamate decarboxylase [Pseudovirgaria hyperparasitica]KAF2762502.1 glutamate decarboxylase [Pseudovirgaria hyperparasitica]